MSLNTQLNGVLEDIGAELGYTATTSLIDWFGGASLYVPEGAAGEHIIKRVIGEKPFQRLVNEWGGQTLNLPLDHRRERIRTARLIGAMITMGKGTKEIAKVALMSERQVHHIRVEMEDLGVLPRILRPADTQDVLPLFDLSEHAGVTEGDT